MANLTLRGVPGALHGWLKEQAKRHHRSVNKEVIGLLEGVQRGRTVPSSGNPEIKRAAIMDISRHCAALPVLDARPEEDILGYNADGIPESSWSSTHRR